VNSGLGVMLGMIAIVETEKIVNASVVADRPSGGVFPIPLYDA
jgi:hypothetical protein